MKTTNILICAALTGMALASCNEVDICESQHPHQAKARFDFNWGERESEKPDTMGVLAYRIVGQNKQLVNVSTATLKIGNDESLAIPVGEYRFYTLPLDDKEIDYSELHAFVEGNSVDIPIHNVGVTYRDYDISDPELKRKLTEWDDFNSYAKYMQPDASPLFYDSTQVISVERDEQLSHTFHPKSLSQTVDINFSINKDVSKTPFIIDEVWAEISGIPRYINLSNCHLDITKTAKMMFPVSLTPAEDSFENKRLACSGTINVPGIVNVQRQKGDTDQEVMRKIHGPGIMQVIIYGHAVDPITGRTRHKKWQGIINLYQPIKNADLMQVAVDGTYVTKKRDHGTINVNANLTIDGDKIVSDSEGDNGLGKWIPTVDILLDI